MKIRIILKGYEEVEFEGKPDEVLKEADEVLVRWKVRFHGKEEGKGR